jgi:hypothetical protein
LKSAYFEETQKNDLSDDFQITCRGRLEDLILFVAIEPPTGVVALSRAVDGTMLVLTATATGNQDLTVEQMKAVDIGILLTFFENHIEWSEPMKQDELLTLGSESAS